MPEEPKLTLIPVKLGPFTEPKNGKDGKPGTDTLPVSAWFNPVAYELAIDKPAAFIGTIPPKTHGARSVFCSILTPPYEISKFNEEYGPYVKILLRIGITAATGNTALGYSLLLLILVMSTTLDTSKAN